MSKENGQIYKTKWTAQSCKARYWNEEQSRRGRNQKTFRERRKVIARTIHFLSEPGAEWSLNLEGAEKLGQCAMEGGRVEENR